MLGNILGGGRTMSTKNSVSMQKIADELGISKVTVSKALNGKDGVSNERKKLIFQTAEKYGYVLPDYGKRKSKKIGVIMSERFNSGNEGSFYMNMYAKIVSEFRAYSYSSFMITPNVKTLESDFKALTEPIMFDGLVFLGIIDAKVRNRFAQIDIPKVYVDIYDQTHKSDSVVTENIYSTYELTDYLIENGHKDIGFVGTVGSTTSITDRYLGYVRRMMESQIEIKKEWTIPDRNDNGEEIEIVVPQKLPTAFVCNCDKSAFELVKSLKAQNIKVPDEVSVVGFDNSIYADICEPKLTTVAVDANKIGEITAKRIRQRMEHNEKKGGEVFRVAGRIIYRDSVKSISDKK